MNPEPFLGNLCVTRFQSLYRVSNIEVCVLKVLKNIENKFFIENTWAYFQENILIFMTYLVLGFLENKHMWYKKNTFKSHTSMLHPVVIKKRDLPWGIASLVFWSWSLIEPLKSGIPVDPEAVPLREWTGLVCPKLSESIRTNVPDLVRTNFWEFLKLELLGLAFWSNWSSL